MFSNWNTERKKDFPPPSNQLNQCIFHAPNLRWKSLKILVGPLWAFSGPTIKVAQLVCQKAKIISDTSGYCSAPQPLQNSFWNLSEGVKNDLWDIWGFVLQISSPNILKGVGKWFSHLDFLCPWNSSILGGF